MTTTPATVFPYTSLPAEIRNLIMEYALVPGHVYPCPKDPPTSRSPAKLLRAVFKRPSPSRYSRIRIAGMDHQIPSTKPIQPGFQLLKTCKTAYEDGHYMFYTMNTFHLPSGSAQDAETWARTLNPEHRSMIKSLCLTFSIKDLTPAVLTTMEKKWLWDLPLKTNRLEQRMVCEVAYLLCWRFWHDKVEWVKGWEGLERVELRVEGREGEMVVWEGGRLEELGGEEEKGVLDRAREVVKVELEAMVREVGWKAVRKALMVRGDG